METQKHVGILMENGTKKVKVKSALYEWKTHNPFQRASTSLIRRVEKELKELKRSKQEPALF